MNIFLEELSALKTLLIENIGSETLVNQFPSRYPEKNAELIKVTKNVAVFKCKTTGGTLDFPYHIAENILWGC